MRHTTMKLFFMLIGVIAIPTATLCAEPTVITVEKAVELALAHNLSLQADSFSLTEARRTMNNAWNKLLPSINAVATLTDPTLPRTVPSLPTSGADAPTLTAGLSASLTLSATLATQIKGAALDYKAGVISYDAAKKGLVRDVSKAFYQILLVQAEIDVEKQAIEAAKKAYDVAVKKYDNGLVSRYDMLSTQVNWESMKPDLATYLVAYDSDLATFKHFLGIRRGTDIRLSGKIGATPVQLEANQLIVQHVGDRFDVLTAENTLNTLENTYTGTVASLAPTLSLGYTLTSTLIGDAYGTSWLDVGNNWSNLNGTLSFTLTLPLDSLIPGSSTATSIANGRDRIARQKLVLESTKESAAIEIENSVRQINDYISSMKSLRLNVELAQEAYKLAADAYGSGTQQLLQVQDAQVTLQRARLKLLTQEYNYVAGLLDVEYALNGKTW